MSCYITKLLPRGSYILSGAPFTTNSGRLRLKGPSSQLVSWKIALRPLQGHRQYWTKPPVGTSKEEPAGDKRRHYGSSPIQEGHRPRHRRYSEGGGDKEEARGKEGGQKETSLVREGHSEGGGTNGGQKGFWERVEHYMSRVFSPGMAVALCAALVVPFSITVYVSWNMRPSKVDQMRNQPIQDLLIGDVRRKVQCHEETEMNRDEIIASIQKYFIKPESGDNKKKFGPHGDWKIICYTASL